ncbi:hypothetical protein BDZ45DRAFT_670777 [Acephala macrosclerotiorum]|nr:hypothetical protein BDZ45DRAFT_670777 [Acephala macrosclerotiorum]
MMLLHIISLILGLVLVAKPLPDKLLPWDSQPCHITDTPSTSPAGMKVLTLSLLNPNHHRSRVSVLPSDCNGKPVFVRSQDLERLDRLEGAKWEIQAVIDVSLLFG